MVKRATLRAIFKVFHLVDSIPKIKQKNLEKMLDKTTFPGYNNEADFGNENNMAA